MASPPCSRHKRRNCLEIARPQDVSMKPCWKARKPKPLDCAVSILKPVARKRNGSRPSVRQDKAVEAQSPPHLVGPGPAGNTVTLRTMGRSAQNAGTGAQKQKNRPIKPRPGSAPYLLTAQALENEQNDMEKALDLALEAHKLAPTSFPPPMSPDVFWPPKAMSAKRQKS